MQINVTIPASQSVAGAPYWYNGLLVVRWGGLDSGVTINDTSRFYFTCLANGNEVSVSAAEQLIPAAVKVVSA